MSDRRIIFNPSLTVNILSFICIVILASLLIQHAGRAGWSISVAPGVKIFGQFDSVESAFETGVASVVPKPGLNSKNRLNAL